MTTRIAHDQLKTIVERIERLEEEKAALNADIKEVYAEAKGNGFDPKILRKLISLRKLAPALRSEIEEMLDLYESAIGTDSEAKTAARVADERRRVGTYKCSNCGEQAPNFEQCKCRSINLEECDADGVVADDPEEAAALLRLTGWHETDEPGPYQSLGGLDDTLTRVFAKAGPITAPARKPTDADLEECN